MILIIFYYFCIMCSICLLFYSRNWYTPSSFSMPWLNQRHFMAQIKSNFALISLHFFSLRTDFLSVLLEALGGFHQHNYFSWLVPEQGLLPPAQAIAQAIVIFAPTQSQSPSKLAIKQADHISLDSCGLLPSI